MTTRSIIESYQNASIDSPQNAAGVALGIQNARRPERNLSNANAPLLGKLEEEGEKGRRGFSVASFTQAAQHESYKPEKIISVGEGVHASGAGDLWGNVQQAVRGEVGQVAIATWFSPCKAVGLSDDTLIIAVENGFTQSQLLKRYGTLLRNALSDLTDGKIGLKVMAQPELFEADPQPAAPATAVRQPGSKRTQWAVGQNPTQNPAIDDLLDKYGDMRGVFLKHSMFEVVLKPYSEGGWNIGMGALIAAGKQHTLERVIWALKEAKAYRGADDRAKVFFHILRNGLRPD